MSVDVTNTGTRTGDEVVPLYVQHMKSKVLRPHEELKGFDRITLQPGETKTVEIPLKVTNLVYRNEQQQKFVVESEPVKLLLGGSSANLNLSTTIQIQ